MSTRDTYTDDEVRAIIDRALQQQPDRRMSHDELLAVASEVGISADAVEVAAKEIKEAREREEATRQILAGRRRFFGSHLWAYAIVNACLFLINFLTTPGQWWVLFPVVLWGMAIAFHARTALSGHVSERALRRLQRRKWAERTVSRVLGAGEKRHHRSDRVRVDSAREELESSVENASSTERRPVSSRR